MAGVVLGIPVLNRPDLLAECLRSIDLDVRLVVIDNSGTGAMGDVVADLDGTVGPKGDPHARAFGKPYWSDALIVEPAANLGYTASVNHIIRCFPDEPRWLIANADVQFAPGDLERLTTEPGWVGITDWRVFSLDAETVDAVGLWDENFQNYCSDADYERRCTLAGVDWRFIAGDTTHVGSVCWTGDERGRANNARTYPLERAYYRDKWGGELRGGETFATPFDKGGSLADWTLARKRLAALRWDGDSR